jgi:sucrose-phosphate synthase
VNPAFTEPFGLTLLEAAAAGLPLVATQDGGPRDILANCKNGILVDPVDPGAIGDAIEKILRDPDYQKELSKIGGENVRTFYSWDAHVDTYLDELSRILPTEQRAHQQGSRQLLTRSEHWVAMDLPPAIEEESEELVQRWRDFFREGDQGMIFATGLSYQDSREVIERLDMPRPAVLISGLGSEIHYGWQTPVKDEVWERQARHRWNRDGVLDAIADLPSLTMQPEDRQHRLKVSMMLESDGSISQSAIQKRLREHGMSAKVIISSGCFVDIVPIRSGKDVALRYLQMKWGIDPASVYYYGTYGNDTSVVRGRNLSAIAADADPVLRRLRDRPRLYRCEKPGLAGFFEGLDFYGAQEGAPPPLPDESFTSEDEQVPPLEINP